MPPAIVAQLLIALGPAALELIPKLAALWGTSTLTPDQITELCSPAKKTWDQYRQEAIASMQNVPKLAPTKK